MLATTHHLYSTIDEIYISRSSTEHVLETSISKEVSGSLNHKISNQKSKFIYLGGYMFHNYDYIYTLVTNCHFFLKQRDKDSSDCNDW